MYVNGKRVTVEAIPGMGEGEYRRMVEGVNSSMIYLIYCRNFVNATMYPLPAQQ
jgi:hypothetical protein